MTLTLLAMCVYGSSDSVAVCVQPCGVRRLLGAYRVSARGGDRRAGAGLACFWKLLKCSICVILSVTRASRSSDSSSASTGYVCFWKL